MTVLERQCRVARIALRCSPVTTSISFRPTVDDLRNLALLEQSGLTRTEAIRAALRESAQSRRRRSELRGEVEALRNDPIDRAAIEETRDFYGVIWDEIGS